MSLEPGVQDARDSHYVSVQLDNKEDFRITIT